jgi:cobalt/nickel transport protein
MSQNTSISNKLLLLSGLGIALMIAAFLSPFASKNPDGLDRVAGDLKFEQKATENSPAKQLPFAQIFQEYSLKAVSNEKVSTALAGVIGTITTFGIAWGVGKLAMRSKKSDPDTEI